MLASVSWNETPVPICGYSDNCIQEQYDYRFDTWQMSLGEYICTAEHRLMIIFEMDNDTFKAVLYSTFFFI